MADFGSDVRSIWGGGFAIDLDPYFTLVDGPLAVAHAVARRFITPTGSLSWDADAGYDLRALLNESLHPAQIPAIEAAVRAEALKDERVSRAIAKVTFVRGAVSDSLSITLSCTTGDGPFELVLAVTSVTVTLLAIR